MAMECGKELAVCWHAGNNGEREHLKPRVRHVGWDLKAGGMFKTEGTGWWGTNRRWTQSPGRESRMTR